MDSTYRVGDVVRWVNHHDAGPLVVAQVVHDHPRYRCTMLRVRGEDGHKRWAWPSEVEPDNGSSAPAVGGFEDTPQPANEEAQ